jgi:hypothetical protein
MQGGLIKRGVVNFVELEAGLESVGSRQCSRSVALVPISLPAAGCPLAAALWFRKSISIAE